MRYRTLIVWLGTVALGCSLATAADSDSESDSARDHERCVRLIDENNNPDQPAREINLCAVEDGDGPVPLGEGPTYEQSTANSVFEWILPSGQLILIVIDSTP